MSARPNILLFFPDQLRGDWTGLNPGLDVRTPELAALAERGAVHADAICPSPVCAPSRACLAFGRRFDGCGVPGNHVNSDLTKPNLYKALRDSGYHTIASGKFDLTKSDTDCGPDGKRKIHDMGFVDGVNNKGKLDSSGHLQTPEKCPYLTHLHRLGLIEAHVADLKARMANRVMASPTPLPDEHYADNWIADRGLDLLREAPDDCPWFLQVNFNGPHDPWDVTESMKASVAGRDLPPAFRPEQDPADVLEVRRNYTAMVENVDRQLGRYIEYLRETGQLDRTLIVFTSDHGEMLGDLGRWTKHVPNQPSVHVPLVIAGPDVVRSHRSAPTETLGLTRFLLDAAETDPAWARSAPGLHGDLAFSGHEGWRMVYDGRHKLVLGGGEYRLYDRAEDPFEVEDLARDPLRRPTLDRLREALESQIRSEDSSLPIPPPDAA